VVLSISAVVLTFIALYFTISKGGHKVWHAVIAVLFGFYLRNTSAAPWISHAIGSLVQMLDRLH
jgi:hypothetical protein